MRQLRFWLLSCGLALLTLVTFTSVPGYVAASPPVAVPAAFHTPRSTYPIVDTTPITRALTYLQASQLSDGGLAGYTAGQSDDFTTIKVALALNAARLPYGYLTASSGLTPRDYLTTRAYSYTHDLSGGVLPGRMGLLMLGAVASDADVTAFGTYPTGHAQAGQSIDMVNALTNTYHAATGAYSTTAQLGWSSGVASALNQSYALLGLAAAQQSVPDAAITFLRDLQETDGGWGYGFGGDVDTTAFAIEALIASGVAPTDSAIQEALSFLQSAQIADGSWGYDGVPSADSTAAVIQALAAVGFTPVTASWATDDGDPQTALAALQSTDGSFTDNALGTAHAIAGLAEMPLPILGQTQRAARALASMHASQDTSGGWQSYGSLSVGGSIDAILAFAAAGNDPDTVSASGSTSSALDFLSSQVFTYTHDDSGLLFPSQTGKAILGIVAAGADPTSFGVNPGGGTLDLVAALEGTYSTATGAYSTTAVRGYSSGTATALSQSFALLALAATDHPIPADALTFLRSAQSADGSWGSVDATGLALQALIAAGVSSSDTDIAEALVYLQDQQDDLGGWDNPNSTAYAIQGLVAAGQDLNTDWLKDGRSPYQALALYQKPDGPFTYSWEEGGYFTPGETNDLATWQAVPGLLGVAYPLKPTALVSYTATNRGLSADRLVAVAPSGSWGNSIDVRVPFGGDIDQDGSATLEWRGVGATDWTTATLTRASGVFTASLDVSGAAQDYDLRVVLTDPDGVQNGTSLETSATLEHTVEALRIYLPLMRR